MEWLALFCIGIFSATIGALLGLGGGVFLVPGLMYLDRVSDLTISPQMAVGTSLAVIVVTALSSTLAYLKQKRVDVTSALVFFCASAPGTVIGSITSRYLDVKWFSLLFGLMLLFFSGLLFVRKEARKRKTRRWPVIRTIEYEGETVEYGFHWGIAMPLSFLVGLLSGLFGIGGGILMVLVLTLLFQFPPHVATATTMLTIFLSSIIGTSTHLAYGHIEWPLLWVIAPGAWIGGKIGANLAKRLKSKQLMLLFRIMLMLIGVSMIWESIQA